MSSVQSHQTSNPNSIAQKAALEALTGPAGQSKKEMIKELHSVETIFMAD